MYAFQAIETRFHGPTDFRGSRYSARADKRIPVLFVGADHALNSTENHAAAAQQFAEKMGWSGKWYAGGTRDGYVFVCVPARFSSGVASDDMVAFTVYEKERE